MNKSKLKVINNQFDRDRIISFLDSTLDTSRIRDHSNNGLQVQGTERISKVGLAVDACMETFKLAVENSCQLLIVHHGIIWNGISKLTGRTYNLVKYLVENGVNLYASHLPLDLHPEVGNNIQLAKILSLQKVKRFGLYNGIEIGYEGVLPAKMNRNELVKILCDSLNTECMVLPFGKETIHRIAIVSGGAGKELTEAIQKDVDCYITGEMIHENYNEALEAGINVVYAGHYHTEKVGVQAVGKLLEKQFGVRTEFFDNPPIIERQVTGASLSFDS